MHKATLYILSMLLLFGVGSGIHLHEHPTHVFNDSNMQSLFDHNCNDHANHPDLLHNHHCQTCSRISAASNLECALCSLGDVAVVDDFIFEQDPHYSNKHYLNKSEPRSPPTLS